MSLEKMRILSLLIIGAAVMAFLSGDFGANFFITQVMVALPLWMPLDLDRTRRWNLLWKLIGMVTLFVFFMSLMGRVGISSRTATFGLVMFCVAYEFYGETREDAPLRLIGLLSFLIVIYQARIESGLNLLAGVLIYLMTLIFTMMSFHLGKIHNFNIPALLKTYRIPILGHAAGIFTIGLMVFWVLPRLPGQSLGVLRGFDANRLSGFSDRVTLNDIGSLKLSRKHVMDLTPLSGVLHSRYLKGKVLDTYRDGVWSYTIYSTDFQRQVEPNRFVFKATQSDTYAYRIDLDPVHGNNLFFFDSLVELKGPLNPMRILGDEDNIAIMKQVPVAMTYTMISDANPKETIAGFQTAAYRRVPRHLDFMKAVTDDLFAATPNASAHEKANGLLNWFYENFTYSLDINNQGEEPLRNFMLSQKKGHCELFASSMVMMLRTQGIPARLVTGFLVPNLHPSGDFFHITEADAHAWVEYEYQGRWHTIDPTPPSEYEEPGFLESWGAVVSRFWRNIILAWNYESQVELIKGIFDNLVTSGRIIADRALLFGVILLLGVAAFATARYQPGKRGGRRRIIALYQKLERKLQHIEPRNPRESMLDYLQRLQLEPATQSAVLRFVQDYQHLRFARDSNLQSSVLEKQGRELLARMDKA